MKSVKAKLRSNKNLACAFCGICEDDEVLYGPMYTISDITCHHFCVLLSSALVQKGKDEEGVQGFLYNDIKLQLKQGNSMKCYLCKKNKATIFCCFRSCRRSFHLPCGIMNNCISLFCNTFQSFCNLHRKKQKIPRNILEKCKVVVVKLEKIPETSTNITKLKSDILNKSLCKVNNINECDNVCYICYEPVLFDNMNDVFWPPCCRGFTWFHRKCLSRMAHSSGRYFIRCPLCNNVPIFLESLYEFGIYIPERDAAWERVNGAFSELTERPNECSAKICKCPSGKKYHKSKSWNMIHCNLCGSEAIHVKCLPSTSTEFNCSKCTIDQDANTLEDCETGSESDAADAIETKENECPESEEIDFNKAHESCIMEMEDNDDEIEIEEELNECTELNLNVANSSQNSFDKNKIETEGNMVKFICENTYVSDGDEEINILKSTALVTDNNISPVSNPPIILTISQSASRTNMEQNKSLDIKKKEYNLPPEKNQNAKKITFKYRGIINIGDYFHRVCHDEDDSMTRSPPKKQMCIFNENNTDYSNDMPCPSNSDGESRKKRSSKKHKSHTIVFRNSLKKVEKKKNHSKQFVLSKLAEKCDIRKYFLSLG